MVVVTTTIRELARPLVKVILDEPKSNWTEKIRKLPLIQKLISETELSGEEKLDRLKLLVTEYPSINDTSYGFNDSEWTKFVRKFMKGVEKCDASITDDAHVRICKSVAESFLEWENFKARWQDQNKTASYYANRVKVEGNLKSVVSKYAEVNTFLCFKI